MPQAVPSGATGKALVNLRNLIASSFTFQTSVGGTSMPEALDRIFYHAPPTEAEAITKPFAVVGFVEGTNIYTPRSYGSATVVAGAVGFEFVNGFFSDPDLLDQLTIMINHTDIIIADMNTGRTVYFDFLRLEVEYPRLGQEDDATRNPQLGNYISRHGVAYFESPM